MYQGSSTKQCLICHKELNQQQDLFHLVNNSSLCLSCIRKFKIINSDIRIQGYHVKVLYEYNDFFRQLLFQYKALDDYALKDCFIESFQELKRTYKNYIIVVIPSSQKDNKRRGFCPNVEIVKTFSQHIFTGLYKKEDYKQTKQKDRSQVKKILSIKEGNLLYKKNVLVFDDVITSSNTLQAAFQQVEKYHPKQIKALVLACPQIDYFKK